MKVRRTELETGAVVVSEAMPAQRSVAFGLYFPTGSRYETPRNNGISHFIEHLVFKGTRSRTADDINREIDLLGGGSNAYTSKEVLCLHGRVLEEHLSRMVALYGDLASEALPLEIDDEIERERGVILSEISAVDDTPEDLVGDLCDEAFFGPHPLGMPVVGTVRSVRRLRPAQIREHYRAHLVADGLVVAAAGAVDHDFLVAQARERLSGVPVRRERATPVPPRPHAATRILERDCEQVQVCISARGIARGDPRHRAQELLSTITGDAYSSRLFREVRDRRGLAYSVSTGTSGYVDAGSFNVYLGVAPERLAEALDVVGRVLADVRDGGISAVELADAKAHVRGSMILGHETAGSHVSYIAEQTLLGQDIISLEEEIMRFERVELGEVNALAREILDGPLALAAVGPVPAGVCPEHGWRLPS